MMQRCVEILDQIGATKSIDWIAKNHHQSPKLIQEIRNSLNPRPSILQLHHATGAFKKATQHIVQCAERLTHVNQ
jgi:hypothetical protein